MRSDGGPVDFRLRSARGHLNGVIRMVAEERRCVDILHQLSAVQGALDQVRRAVLEAHLRYRIPEAVAEGQVDDFVNELVAVINGAASGSRSEHDGQHAEPEPPGTVMGF